VLPAIRQLTVNQIPRCSLSGSVELPVFATSVTGDSGQCAVAERAVTAAATPLAAYGQPRLGVEETRVTSFGIRAISANRLLGPSSAACLRVGLRFDSLLASSQPSSSP
jgi:hypothetical protein